MRSAGNHEKNHLVAPVILTRTRYIGFNRYPVRDDSTDSIITGMSPPQSDYRLVNGGRWVDGRRRP